MTGMAVSAVDPVEVLIVGDVLLDEEWLAVLRVELLTDEAVDRRWLALEVALWRVRVPEKWEKIFVLVGVRDELEVD